MAKIIAMMHQKNKMSAAAIIDTKSISKRKSHHIAGGSENVILNILIIRSEEAERQKQKQTGEIKFRQNLIFKYSRFRIFSKDDTRPVIVVSPCRSICFMCVRLDSDEIFPRMRKQPWRDKYSSLNNRCESDWRFTCKYIGSMRIASGLAIQWTRIEKKKKTYYMKALNLSTSGVRSPSSIHRQALAKSKKIIVLLVLFWPACAERVQVVIGSACMMVPM